MNTAPGPPAEVAAAKSESENEPLISFADFKDPFAEVGDSANERVRAGASEDKHGGQDQDQDQRQDRVPPFSRSPGEDSNGPRSGGL